ncbi:hypothetical protein AGOR_G00049500 [Albula goreensis]|uniref:ARID domain-containing protein n=1 Tax=Albula goreensis TaxID=1534307 RepID=A0A8T3DX39_9TELE|nr:hypothetical protein AGOR_G00049500 [Albula goreensis]
MSTGKMQGAVLPARGVPKTEAMFLEDLYLFMSQRGTPIQRVPQLGFKQLDLFLMYKIVKNLGGFDEVTANQQWKQVYNMLGGDLRCTSAATNTRRHYEKLILPFVCSLTRARDSAFTPPQPLKSFLHDSTSLQDENGPQDSKCSTLYRPQDPSVTQAQSTPHSFPDSRVNVAPQTVHHQLNLDPPAYLSLFPKMVPPQTNPQPHIHPRPHPHTYPHEKPFSLVQPVVIYKRKQQLAIPTALAMDSCFSSGQKDPLDLSCRGNRGEAGALCPSSALPLSSKAPKFLNQVSPLYSPWHAAKAKACEPLGSPAAKEARLTQCEFASGVQEKAVIDLTSCDSSPSSTPPPTENDLSPLSRPNTCFSTQDATVNRTPRLNLPLFPIEKMGDLYKLHSSLLDPASTSIPPQIEMVVSQALLGASVKGRFEGLVGSGSLPNKYATPNTALQLHDQDKRNSFEGPVHRNSASKEDGATVHPFAQYRPRHTSTDVLSDHLDHKWQDWRLATDQAGWPYPQHRQSEALRPFHTGQLETQRGCPNAPPITFERYPLYPAMSKQEESHCRLRLAAATLELLKGIPGTSSEPPEGLRDGVTPPYLLHLTPEEYLRNIISSSL